jgi:hypothetical protein
MSKSFVRGRWPARSRAELEALTPSQREANRAAFHALALMRDGRSRAEAVRRAGTTPAAMMRHVGPALQKRGRRWIAMPADRLLRVMQVLGEDGPAEVSIRGSRVASLISSHWAAIDHYLLTDDAEPLRALSGKRAGGVVLETDPDRIDAWDRRGELAIEDIYSLTS